MSTRLLSGGVDAQGSRLDVRIDDGDGTILSMGSEVVASEGEQRVDCSGMVVLAAQAEPHLHLDKVDTAWRLKNPSGELMDAVKVWMDNVPTLDADEVCERAVSTIDDYVANGATSIRSHVNLSPQASLAPLEGLLAARDRVADRCDVQLVALVPRSLAGASEVAEQNRALVRRAVELGVDLVGGAPHSDADPSATTDVLVELAAELDVGIDLHTDETLDPGAVSLSLFARRVARLGLSGRATASHCVSLGIQPPSFQTEVAELLEQSGVAVIALPATNLWLQARGVQSAPPRGVTAVRALLDAGVTVGSGADNLRDPFCPIGRADPLETAALLAVTAHLTLTEAWWAVTGGARGAMGVAGGQLHVGAPAEILAVAGRDLDDAIARASARRITVHRGRVVAETTVSRSFPAADAPATATATAPTATPAA
ncbi:amidohydrolase family protein [soil metagenome]